MIKCQRKGFNKQAIKFNMRIHHRTIMIIPSRKKWSLYLRDWQPLKYSMPKLQLASLGNKCPLRLWEVVGKWAGRHWWKHKQRHGVPIPAECCSATGIL